MAAILFDTSIYISYNPKLRANLLMSAVVIQELVAGAPDSSEVQKLEALRITYERDGKLLVPTGEDWWLAGKVLNSLFRGLKSKSKPGGRTLRITKQEQQRIVLDVLIARTVKRANALLVTDNVADFARIKQFCNVSFVSGLSYFRH